ncbi:MAG: lysylphosphatidylglycerol synthase transmembrane domain-containing protein [bacterium]|nr:lysylphosphatidylglycerol synthase transmembrane domain-containing protein [bacterium]
MKIIKIILFICGILLFVTIIRGIDIKKLFEILQRVNFYFIFIGFILLALEVLIRSLKLKRLISLMGNIKLKDCFIIYLMGMPFGSVTPGRIGDLVRVYTIKQKTRLSMTNSFAIWVLDRFMEVLALFGLASIGLLVFLVHQRLNGEVFHLLLFLACITIFLLFFIINLKRKWIKQILKLFYQIVVPHPVREKFSSNVSTFYLNLTAILENQLQLLNILILSLLSWILVGIRGFIYGLSLGMDIKLIYFILLVPVINAVEILPISIMGIGTRDYTTILLYSSLGVSKEYGLSLSLMLFILGLIPQMVVGYFIAWQNKLK